MPKEMEMYLNRMAMKKFGSKTSKRARKYVYGTMAKMKSKKGGSERMTGMAMKMRSIGS